MSVKPQDLRNMTKEELQLKLDSSRSEIYRLSYEAKAGNVEKPHKIKEMRRDIARCMTILKEKEVEKKKS